MSKSLDEILTELCKNTQVDYGYEKLVPIETDKAKQAILDWHNKQINNFKGIIKMADKYTFDTGEVYYNQKAVNKQIEEVLDRIESQQGKIDLGSYSDMQRAILPEAIEAERNKLKEN